MALPAQVFHVPVDVINQLVYVAIINGQNHFSYLKVGSYWPNEKQIARRGSAAMLCYPTR